MSEKVAGPKLCRLKRIAPDGRVAKCTRLHATKHVHKGDLEKLVSKGMFRWMRSSRTIAS